MKAIAEPASGHGPSRKFIDDYHLIVPHQIIDVAFKKHMGLKGLVHMVQLFDIAGIIEVFHPQQLLP